MYVLLNPQSRKNKYLQNSKKAYAFELHSKHRDIDEFIATALKWSED